MRQVGEKVTADGKDRGYEYELRRGEGLRRRTGAENRSLGVRGAHRCERARGPASAGWDGCRALATRPTFAKPRTATRTPTMPFARSTAQSLTRLAIAGVVRLWQQRAARR